MGDTMVDSEEEATKQEVSSEPLPEPLLIILSPPPPFLPAPGQPTMFWHKWLKSFSRYLEALGEHQLVDSSKCDLLQNCLGAEGRHVFASLVPGDATYAEVISALTGFFTADPTAQMYRLEFHHRAQMPGETTEQFASALRELLWRCDFGDVQEKRVLDQLMAKTSYPHLRERLLPLKDTLTLEEALLVGKEVESALSESEACGFNQVSVAIEDDSDVPVPIKAKRGRPRKGEKRTAAKPPVTKTSKQPSRRKDNFCYGKDKLYIKCKSSAETTPACDGPGDEEDIEASSSSQVVKEEACDDDDEDDDEDDDFVDSAAKLKGPYCPFCTGRRFRDANKLGRHMRTHTKEKPFSCPVCSLTFSQSYHMTRHLRNQHGAGQHVCSTCGESLGSFAELKSHKRAHGQTLSCAECGEAFTNHDTLRSHALSHGKTQEEISQQSDDAIDQVAVDSSPNNDSNDSVDDAADDDSDSSWVETQEKGCNVNIKMEEDSVAICQDGAGKKDKVASKAKPKGHFCPICDGRRFRGPNKLARHMRTHTKEKPFTCPICSLTFSQSYHMTRHVRNQHGSGKYICSKCGKGSSSWLELKTHRKTHAGDGLKCLACDTQFKEKAALVSHLKLHKKVHASPRSLICGDCGKVFRRLYHLKRHIKTHRKAANSESFTCPDCHKKFAFPEDLNKHLEVHVKENNGTCPKCDRTFPSPEELETHMEVHDKTYACSTCGKKFKVEYALKKHEQVHQNEQYYCSLCRKRFIKLSHYKRHLLVHERRECKCPHCDSVFLQVTALKYHLRTHSEERPHQCVCCIETFEAEEDLEQHRLKHRKYKKERPFSCTRCDSAFPTLVALTEHMGEHEGELPSNCPVCGKTFLNKKKLEKHLSIHTGERPHLCSVCGNGFPSAASLKLHVTIHTGEKPFKCSQCAKSFRSSSGLRLHGRQHMEVRPIYECPECGRTYGRMTELKMHQRYHTGDKPYSCTCCSKRFISKDKLNVHMRTHTGERPYSCPHCGQTFTQTGDRNRHISKYH